MKDAIPSGILKALDTLVMVRSDEGTFTVVGEVPEWFHGFLPDGGVRAGMEIHPSRVFAFLDSFLVDANEFWDGFGPRTLESSLWQEDDPLGHEHQLRATGLRLGDCRVLLIAQVTDDYAQRQDVVQKAREQVLVHEALVKEIQKKEILLHAIVHDLMGPLTSMAATYDILSGENLSAVEIREMLDIGKKTSLEQKNMIEQILTAFSSDIGTTDYSKMPYDEAPDAYRCAQEAAESFIPAYARGRVKLRILKAPPDGACKVVAERGKLLRVLFNLLENALRHSPEGSTVAVGVEDDGQFVRLYVDDEGPGLPKKLTGQLFHSFVKGEERSGKSGLGLYFCRITIERWGGTIGVSPREKRGSRFWVRLRKPIPRLLES